MIGVIPKETESKVVQEFFQLFKTPWELYVPGHDYDLVIATSDEIPSNLSTKVLTLYSSQSTGFDCEKRIVPRARHRNHCLECNGSELPVYGDLLVFEPAGEPFLWLKGKPETVGLAVSNSTRQTVRIGYDLFQEVSFLLSKGQPPENAHVPTLEIHIALLRNCMLNAGIPFVELPPLPAGYDFMACLTHDVDFIGIRQHKFDHTMWGFLYRALVGSLMGVLKGRMPWAKLVQNWKAALSLPFVYLKWQPDFWNEFDRYLQLERGVASTFFFIPYKNHAGEQVSGQAPKRRAAKYEVADIAEQVHQLASRGCEIGLHGIDAWNNPQKGHRELSRIREITAQSEVGVRMHWLYSSERSPQALEEAGFSYDSTFGYNEAAGFRAGTTQVFCPLTAQTLLELPLNIQDTALFYPTRMNLSEAEALDLCTQFIRVASVFGGALTVNWHTRSLSPERLWGDFYTKLLKRIQEHRVWFGNAEQIVSWFRQRRALRFAATQFAQDRLLVKLTGSLPDGQPPLVVRVYHPRFTSSAGATDGASMPPYRDFPCKGETELEITL